MFLNEPTMYGATLPQREIPLQTPFVNPYILPWQNLPLHNVPWQYPQAFQRFVPPITPFGFQPFFPRTFGLTEPFMTPFQPPVFDPFFKRGLFETPLYNWQKPWY